jgi:hypothetical protein
LPYIQSYSLLPDACAVSHNVPFQVVELRPFMKNLSIDIIVLEKNAPMKTKDDKVITLVVADETGCIKMSLFDGKGDGVRPGDILRVTGGHSSLFKHSLTLYSRANSSKLERIGDFSKLFSESPNLSAWQWQEDPNNPGSYNPIPGKGGGASGNSGGGHGGAGQGQGDPQGADASGKRQKMGL